MLSKYLGIPVCCLSDVAFSLAPCVAFTVPRDADLTGLLRLASPVFQNVLCELHGDGSSDVGGLL